jgi:TetR/AcrR family transcriptional regulator
MMDNNGDTEQKILQAARTVFLKKGHDGARMQEIADLAGINKALLHYYFRSKDKLFRTIFHQELLVMFDNIFSAISPSDTFHDFLQKFVHEYLINISPRRNMMRFILWELENSAEELAGLFFEAFQKRGFTENPIILRVEQAVKNGEIRAVEPINFILNLMGMCIFPFIGAPLLTYIIPGFNSFSDTFTKEREKAILELVWTGVRIED